MLKIILGTDPPKRKIKDLKNWGLAKLHLIRGSSTTIIRECTTVREIYSGVDGDSPASTVISWQGPRTVIVPRTDQGFGFTLRHFIVYPPESTITPQFQDGETIGDENDPEVCRHKRTKLSDLEPMDTIFVKHVKEAGPAHQAGLNTGDRIVSVNGEPVTGKTYSQVIALIQASDSSLKLLVVPKDEDILQMAYQNTAYNQTSETFLSHSTLGSRQHSSAVMFKDEPSFVPDKAKERKVSFTFGETSCELPKKEARQLVTSASYTSGISLQREPLKSDNMNKNTFRTRKQEFEARALQNNRNSDGTTHKINTYSFGLYFPPKKENKSSSVDNVSYSGNAVRSLRENILQSRESLDNVNRCNFYGKSSWATNDDKLSWSNDQTSKAQQNNSSHSSTWTTSFSGQNWSPDPRSGYFRRSQTTSALSAGSSPETLSPQQPSAHARQMSSISKEQQFSARHYVPVVSQTSVSRRTSSVDRMDPSLHHLTRLKHDDNRQLRYSDSSNPTSPSRTLFVRISGEPAHGRSQRPQSIQTTFQFQSSGKTVPISNSPLQSQGEAQKAQRPFVLQRKKQFESPVSETAPSATVSTTVFSPSNWCKSEIDQLTSKVKYESIATRAAQFESKQPNDTPQSTTLQPAIKVRRITTDRYQPSESTDKSFSSKSSSPLCIYVSKSPSTPVSPVIEIRPTSHEKTASDPSNVHFESSPSHSYSKDVCIVEGFPSLWNDSVEVRDGLKQSFVSTINKSINNAVDAVDDRDDVFTHPTFTPSEATSSVILRKKSEGSAEEDAIKLHRRTSYLMALARERANLSLPVDKFSSQSDHHHCAAANHSVGLKKLKSVLWENTPRIAEVVEQKPEQPSPSIEVMKEGVLSCKTAITDGKKSSDRSWKLYSVSLRNQSLYLQKERKDSSSQPTSLDEQQICIIACLIDVAHDYTKKKNVFRLTTSSESEYLFHADDHDTMMAWIQAIKNNAEVDSEEKSAAAEQSTSTPPAATKSSPQMPSKTKKLPILPFRPKIPHSPSRRRKNEDGGKSKSWKGKLGRTFKKQGPSTTPATEEASGTFGIPLEDCTPSPYKESVPLIVDLCTQIVDARGLEVTGVYRIPGNTLAISMMQEELNKGIENINIDNDKWQDVNVISSLLKAYFRKLPEPLVTNDLYQQFIDANRIEQVERRMLTIKRLLHDLPEHHFETFRHLSEHLNKVASYKDMNKMCARNLAIVLGPTLIRRTGEDMHSMAMVMSDQCQIIESIIKHHEWFFSSWDVDSYVPLDENGDTPPPTVHSMCPLTKDDLSDENQVDPKDIVASIISAANKKLHSKDKKGVDEVDTPGRVKYEERNIDQEIAKRQTKSQMSVSQESEGSMTSIECMSSDGRKESMGSSIVEEELMDWVFVRQCSETPQSVCGKQPVSRCYSDESLVEKSDELEISHGGLNSSYSLSRDTLDRLRRIELEARTLREQEEYRQQEREKRRLEQQKIEQEYQRTKKELELEESHSVEDLLNAPEFPNKFSNYRTALLSPLVKQGEQQHVNSSHDSSSLQGSPLGTFAEGQACNSSSARSKTGAKSSETTSGGKFFVSVANTKMIDEKRFKHLQQGNFDSLASRAKRAGSLETIIDTRASGRNGWKDSERSPHRDFPEFGDRHSGYLSHSSSLRRCSLDSMIDFYDKHDNRISWVSTDSEDGSDLLTSLTTTFDQKLKILLNPKYKLNGGARRVNRFEDCANSSTQSDSTDDRESSQSFDHMESCRLLNLGLHYTRQFKGTDSVFDSFRDPSLHRSQKSEAKIGIASRFERTPTSSPSLHLPADGAIITHGAAPIATNHLNVATAEMKRRDLADAGNLRLLYPGYSDMSAHGTTGDGDSLCRKKLGGGIRMEKNSSRVDKVDHFSLSKLGREERYCSSKLEDWHMLKSRSTSPPTLPKRKGRGKRRHTVGGSGDLEHFKALVSLAKGETKMSAWEQLQPAIKLKESRENRALLSWLQKDRLRSSSPELFFQRTSKKV